jgi:hypothetical protein
LHTTDNPLCTRILTAPSYLHVNTRAARRLALESVIATDEAEGEFVVADGSK